jgi:hypothetical protein
LTPSPPPEAEPEKAVRPLRLCLFGDSHIACLRYALNHSPAALDPHDVEFWGTTGNRFRFMSLQDGAIVPDDDFTAKRFSVISKTGRTRLSPAGLDAILFMGCRTRIDGLFLEFLHRNRTPGMALSSGVKAAMIAGHLRAMYAYRFAMDFARQGRARIVFAPVSFPVAGFAHPGLAEFPDGVQGTKGERAAIWALVREVMAEDGITLLPQPDRTVTEGCFTLPAFATRRLSAGDHMHKNAGYGAAVLRGLRGVLAG